MSNDPVREIHWPTTATARPPCSRLEEDTTADVVIIGGGLTGCRTALGLAEAGLSVVLLEARDIGWGASGRSGGQCNPVWRQTPDELASRFGDARAELLVRTTLSAADDLFHDIEHYDVECDAVQNGWVQAAHTRQSRRSLEHLQAGWSQAGARIDLLEAEQVKDMSGSPAYRFALFHQAGGHVHPLSLTRGYARAAQARGARIFCEEPVQSMERRDGKWKVSTVKGSVTAEQVVQTTNGYTGTSPSPGLQKTFLPLVSIALATEPLSESLRATVLPGSVTLSDTRLAIYFCRYDRDGRLIFGCVGSSEHVGKLAIARLQKGLHTVFPQLRGTALERTWGGRIAVTPEMMPHIHEPAPGLTSALGFSGRGIAMTSVMGRALTRKVLGEPESSLPFPVQPVSAIPFHGPLKAMIPMAAPAMSVKDRLDSMMGGL
ncbi:NAD(P)/FAD-dependent oxidoreductase [Granulosicoccus sp. 3-233]|uniref:NAD(P)/FAD-dependent oxidoreductase n=1 Tax=Granulosicoccus sp. 3-233 TaxID=3417969 RepID=UPI003D329AEB